MRVGNEARSEAASVDEDEEGMRHVDQSGRMEVQAAGR